MPDLHETLTKRGIHGIHRVLCARLQVVGNR